MGRQHEGEYWSKWRCIEDVIAAATRTSDELIERAGQLKDDEEVELPYQVLKQTAGASLAGAAQPPIRCMTT